MSTAPPRASLLLLAYLAFVSLGLPDGLIGVGWPSIRADFGVPTEAVGLVLTAGTAGYLTSSVLAGFTLARLGVGWLLAGSTLLASLALTGYASTPRARPDGGLRAGARPRLRRDRLRPERVRGRAPSAPGT